MKSHKVSYRSPKTQSPKIVRPLAKRPRGKEKCVVISNQSEAAADAPLITNSLITSPTKRPASAKHLPSSVALKLRAPAAKEVFVAGSFNGWQVGATPLRPAKGGVWQGELKLTPGRYEYLFVVDGTWLPDPAAPETAPNPFGGWNSVLSVS